MRHDPARTLSLRVPRELRPRLDTLARARGTSRHAAAVEALTAGVEALTAAANELPAQPSAAPDSTPAPPPPPPPPSALPWYRFVREGAA